MDWLKKANFLRPRRRGDRKRDFVIVFLCCAVKCKSDWRFRTTEGHSWNWWGKVTDRSLRSVMSSIMNKLATFSFLLKKQLEIILYLQTTKSTASHHDLQRPPFKVMCSSPSASQTTDESGELHFTCQPLNYPSLASGVGPGFWIQVLTPTNHFKLPGTDQEAHWDHVPQSCQQFLASDQWSTQWVSVRQLIRWQRTTTDKLRSWRMSQGKAGPGTSRLCSTPVSLGDSALGHQWD